MNIESLIFFVIYRSINKSRTGNCHWKQNCLPCQIILHSIQKFLYFSSKKPSQLPNTCQILMNKTPADLDLHYNLILYCNILVWELLHCHCSDIPKIMNGTDNIAPDKTILPYHEKMCL